MTVHPNDDEVLKLAKKVARLESKLKWTRSIAMGAFGLGFFATIYHLLKMFGIGR